MRRPIIDEDERKQKIRIKRRAAALKSAAKRRNIKEHLNTEHTNYEDSCKNLINSKRGFIVGEYEKLKNNSFYVDHNDRTPRTLSIADHSHDRNHACYVQSHQGIC